MLAEGAVVEVVASEVASEVVAVVVEVVASRVVAVVVEVAVTGAYCLYYSIIFDTTITNLYSMHH